MTIAPEPKPPCCLEPRRATPGPRTPGPDKATERPMSGWSLFFLIAAAVYCGVSAVMLSFGFLILFVLAAILEGA